MGGGSEGDEEQDASSLDNFYVFVFLYLVPETNYLNPGLYSPSRPSMRGGAVEGTGDDDDDGDFNDNDDVNEDTNDDDDDDDDDDDVICALTKHL